MVHSVAPGLQTTIEMAQSVSNITNMYRVSDDVWDTWEDIEQKFDIARDFAHANLLGSNSLNGKSWPDFDALPLGTITEPGSSLGPHRKTKLIWKEQKTQITLWAMARSPMFFGGDMRKLDQGTLDLLTNPVALEINSFSYGNSELSKLLPTTTILKLTDCAQVEDIHWALSSYNEVTDQPEKVCWNHEDGCLHWIPAHGKSLLNENEDGEKFSAGHILTNSRERLCIKSDMMDSNSTDSEPAFVSCHDDLNRKWRITTTGKLISEQTNECVVGVTHSTIVPSNLTRIWISRGLSGEIYVAYFNLNSRRTKISLQLGDLMQAVRNMREGHVIMRDNAKWRCQGFEAWTKHNVGILRSELSWKVHGHDASLFSLTCGLNIEVKTRDLLSKALVACFIVLVVFSFGATCLRYFVLSKRKEKVVT